ncbi:hypothetical protein FKM82_030928 [Ascaphus truei]
MVRKTMEDNKSLKKMTQRRVIGKKPKSLDDGSTTDRALIIKRVKGYGNTDNTGRNPTEDKREETTNDCTTSPSRRRQQQSHPRRIGRFPGKMEY